MTFEIKFTNTNYIVLSTCITSANETARTGQLYVKTKNLDNVVFSASTEFVRNVMVIGF